MDKIIPIDGTHDTNLSLNNYGSVELTGRMLEDTRASISNSSNTLSVPIAELSTLGTGVASLIPSLNAVTQTTTVATEGLYQLTNVGVSDVLKLAKNGNFWGAFKNADGASKLVQLQKAGPVSVTTTNVAPFNPATMLMAVALFSIETKLGEITDMEKRILSFLEIEKESEIEADIETLVGIARNFKLTWDNEHFVASNHKLVLDIQRTARKNMFIRRRLLKP